MASEGESYSELSAAQLEALMRSLESQPGGNIESHPVKSGTSIKQQNDAKLFKVLEIEQFAQDIHENAPGAQERYEALQAEERRNKSLGSRMKLRAVENHLAAMKLQSRLISPD